MTVRGLISKLKKIEKKNPGARICIELSELRLVVSDDELTHYAIIDCKLQTIRWRGVNDEWENKDGSEKLRSVAALIV